MREPTGKAKTKWTPGISAERRAGPRVPGSQVLKGGKAQTMTGAEINLVEVSRSGALLRSQKRLTPSSSIRIKLITPGAVYILSGRILRCAVASLREKGLQYEAAISFDQEFPLFSHREISASAPADDIVAVARDVEGVLESDQSQTEGLAKVMADMNSTDYSAHFEFDPKQLVENFES